jgi:[protein-PII] uridylyltransferase
MISRLVIHPEQLASMAAQIQDRRLRPHQASSFSVVPDVTIDNALSHDYTVLEVSGLDRPGLLYDITSALARLNIDIRSAHIATFGERAVDVFYIVNELNQKITHIAQQERIRATLLPILDQV